MQIKSNFTFAIILLSTFLISLFLPSFFLLKHGITIQAEFFVNYPDSVYFGNNIGIEDLDWRIEYYDVMIGWVEHAVGTTGSDGIISADLYPYLDYRLTATNGWSVPFGEVLFNSTTIFPYEIEVDFKSLKATFKYDMPGQPPAYPEDILLYYFDGSKYVYYNTLSTSAQGVVVFSGLIVGNYSFESSGIPSYNILDSTFELDVGVILLAPTCILIYRKIEGKEGLF